MSITFDWIKISCIKLYGKMHHGHSEMTTWPKVETGSYFAWRHQMNVWSICASISVSITDIWTKFGTEHKYHTIPTRRNGQIRINWKSKMAAAAILNFGKMSITLDWTRRHQMKVQSISVLISVTIADIWTKFYIELKYHTINMTECSKCTRLENARWRRPPSWISENVNNSELDRVICAKFGGQMHQGHA